ncbi:stage V sporulation protein B [Tumebacillus lipolyticus]|uniref:Stage V sporulation protein B n=1 Tax=Tumebacillus lipolyticus TaxID=1280370 RepID=A0ABW4ZUQ6_9BACL
MSKQSFLKGAVILVAASLITRVLGFVYKIFLSRLIGAEGIGLFYTVFPILMFLITLTTAGLPVAISKLVAEALVEEDTKRVKRIVSVSMKAVVTLSLIFTTLLLFLAPVITDHILTDTRAYYTLLAMSPIILIIAISSILRGYFQGLQNMTPNAIASIVEQLARIATVLFFATYLLPYGLEYAAAGAMIGMVIGELVGLLYLVFKYYTAFSLKKMHDGSPNKPLEPFRKMLSSVLEIALPITMSRIVGSIAYTLEPILVTRCLVMIGLTAAVATTQYGQYSGMAISLLYLPTVFTYSLQTTLVPAISEAVAAGAHSIVQRRLYQTFRLTAMIGFPTSALLSLYANELSNAIFHDRAVGPILAIMAPVGFLLYLQGPLSGILQGLNRAGEAMRNSIIGSIVKLVIIYYLVSDPRFGISGVAWSVVISVTVVTILHFLSVTRLLGFYVNLVDTFKLIIASSLLCVWLLEFRRWFPTLSDSSLVLLGSLSGFVIYFLLLNLMGALTLHTIAKLPRVGPTLAGILRAVPFLR